MKYLTPLILALAAACSGSAKQPNILFIAVDDLKPILGVYGTPIPTPNIDRIADRGTTFLNAHCQQAICAPSRASLMTGKRPDGTGVWDLKTKLREAMPGALTLPEYLQTLGYHTAGVGKIFDPRSVDKGGDSPSWSQPYRQTWHLQYDEVTGKPAAHYHNPKSRTAAKEAEAAGKSSWSAVNRYLLQQDAWPAWEAEAVPDDAYDDGAIAAYAVDELGKLAAREEPFFFAVGFKKPHLPFVAPKKYWDIFDPDGIELADFQRQALNGPNIAYHSWNELRSYSGIPQRGPVDEATEKQLIHGYYACVAYIDAQVGKILDQLEALDLNEDTIVVFWGDHGFHLGDHGLWCKHSNFEQATRVPLIIAPHQGRRGRTTGMPVELIDLFPTLVELAGLPQPENLDGLSLVPTLQRGKEDLRDFAVSQFPRGSAMGYALRTGRFRFVAWYKTEGEAADGKGEVMATELFDYKNDPLETRNLAGEPQYAQISAELQARLSEFLQDYAAR